MDTQSAALSSTRGKLSDNARKLFDLAMQSNEFKKMMVYSRTNSHKLSALYLPCQHAIFSPTFCFAACFFVIIVRSTLA
jgi:hypothetical protein